MTVHKTLQAACHFFMLRLGSKTMPCSSLLCQDSYLTDCVACSFAREHQVQHGPPFSHA